MKTTIKLYGKLRKEFGHEYKFVIDSPSEAFRALSQLNGFTDYIKTGYYKIIKGDLRTGQTLNQGDLRATNIDRKTIHIVPSLCGAGAKGTAIAGAVIVAAALTVAHFYSGGLSTQVLGTTLGNIAWSGGLMMVTGAVAWLMQIKPGDPQADIDKNESDVMSGNISAVNESLPVPVLYGQTLINGTIVSASIEAEASGK